MKTTAIRRSLGQRLLIWLVGVVGWAAVELLGHTWRVETQGQENLELVYSRGERAIFAFWHGQLFPLCFTHRNRMIHTFSSVHRDGDFMVSVLRRLGFGSVRGSTSRRAVRGLVRMIATIREGYDAAVTPDGPRGPAGSVQPGIFYMAEKTGFPVVPVGVGASPKKVLGSWDSFTIPLPFSRVVVVIGQPIYVTAPAGDAGFAGASKRLRAELDALTRAAASRAAGSAGPCPTSSTGV